MLYIILLLLIKNHLDNQLFKIEFKLEFLISNSFIISLSFNQF